MSATESGERIDLESGVVTERSPFTVLLETPAAVRVVDILYRYSYTALTLGEIADRADRDPATVAEALRVLVESPLVSVNSDGTYEAPVRETDAADHLRWLKTGLAPDAGDIQRAGGGV